jgi:hypothetical protein
MRRWLERQIAKPDTAILGYEEMIVEWDGTSHKFHRLTRPGFSGKQPAKEEDSSCQ